MRMTVKPAMTLLVVCAMFALSGCAYCSKISCAAPHAKLPETVSAGETLTIEAEDLWVCPDTCGGSPEPMIHVTVEAMGVDSGKVVATTTVPVNDDATANVALRIPANIDGSLVIRTSDEVYEFGTVTVVRD